MEPMKAALNLFLFAIVVLLVAVLIMIMLTIFSMTVVEYSINLNMSFPQIRENYIVSFIPVTTSIVTIALPLSINAVKSAKGSQYESDEMKETFFAETEMKMMWRVLFILGALLISSMFELGQYFLYNLATLVAMVFSLYWFRRYLIMVQKYVSDFGAILLEKENREAERILKP